MNYQWLLRRSPIAPSAKEDPTLREAMTTWIFWLFVIGMTVRVGAYSTISVHFVPIMVWKGMSQEGAALLLASFAFSELGGALRHRLVRRHHQPAKTFDLCMLAAAASMLLLVLGDGAWPLWAFTIGFTAIDASFPIVWATIGDFFGRKYFATIRGTMSFLLHLGQRARAGHRRRRLRPQPKLCRDVVRLGGDTPTRRHAHGDDDQTVERNNG